VASIRATRVHQPIIVTQRGARYLIVFGERRWRASGLADKKTVPSIVRNMTDVDIKVARLVENMQREDVDPIEEAAAIKELIEILGGGRGVQKKAAEMLGPV
jgi:ParB family chromosome partitioning protein